ncbi:MAG: HlyC/CorC family transporter [SAR324 cluster bacterium]|uniref:HlyC/CorC family transporter n=1 Tax=SAR324 cluster bacterium TaxID=2024889 RepID=A0A7X9FU44_9DELT|nr:HlyC/CorC family transporter [SAR324 cluster bacterium]
MFSLIVISIAAIIGSALVSTVEAALFSCPLIKARQMVEQRGTKSAKALLKIRENMSRPISAMVLLANLFAIIGSLIIGAVAANELDTVHLSIFSVAYTILFILFAEIIPKNFGERHAVSVALFGARPLILIAKILSPLIWIVERFVSPSNKNPIQSITTENEIKLLVQVGKEEGIIEQDEADMIHRIFKLNDVMAKDIMTPRVSITSLEGKAILAEVKDEVLRSQHSRIVLFGDSTDEVIGIALKDELLKALIENKGETKIIDLARPPHFVPSMVRADNLLSFFQEHRDHIAVVVDEFGGTAGVVTLEDVLEVLTGEIVDETDRVMDMQAAARRRRFRFSFLRGSRKK